MNETALPISIKDSQVQRDYQAKSDECQEYAHAIKMIKFMKHKIQLESQSFTSTKNIKIPLFDAIISTKIEPYINGSGRFLFSIYSQKVPFVLSTYYDKIIFDINDVHFEWQRDPINLEIDSLEYIIPVLTYPLNVSFVVYPDTPLQFFIVPDDLREITETNYDFFAHIVHKVTNYAAINELFQENGDIECDSTFKAAFNQDKIPMKLLPFYVKSVLLPVQPLKSSFVLEMEHPRYNLSIKLPDCSFIPQTSNSEENKTISKLLNEFAEQRENVELLAAIARNPYEAIEAEICGHATHCELSDESNDNGPKVSVDSFNAAKRSTAFYWQPWVQEHASKFLEENRQIHARYTKK